MWLIATGAEKRNTSIVWGRVSITVGLEQEMLDELKRIREAVTPKAAPPPPRGIWAEFVDFIGKSGVLGLAIGFIMGPYVNKVV
jgi:hypothetical protein